MDNQPANPKQTILERLQQATNILVTVSRDPSVDELASCLGMTLWLNKIGKHATAVFSGEVPSTLEFLQPAETLEKNTDSLRDFIIALDKSKADKLRYKVEDEVVKIFITPYRTSLSAADLEYSQGDFNVEMVVALGVTSQEDLDTAVTAHGRILHDATVATITVNEASELGSINWNDGQASSLSELVVELGNAVGRDHLDGQIATALLTGVVAETARFSNEKTTPQTMSVSAELMAAGANQQLVASKLDQPAAAPAEQTTDEKSDTSSDDNSGAGTLEIEHEGEGEPEPEAEPAEAVEVPAEPEPTPEPEQEPVTDDARVVTNEPIPGLPAIEDVKANGAADEAPLDLPPPPPIVEPVTRSSKLVTEPPSLGGTLTANSRPDDIMREPSSDALTPNAVEAQQPLVSRSNEETMISADQPDMPLPPPAPTPQTDEPPFTPPQPAAPDWMPPQPWLNDQPSVAPVADVPLPPPAPVDEPAAEPADSQTLSEIEASVDSPHVANAEPAADAADLDSARDEVLKALNSMPDTNPEPVQALNATAIDLQQPVVADQPSAVPAQTQDTQFDPTSFDISNNPTPNPVGDALAEPLDPTLTTPVDQPFTMPLPTPPAANPMPPVAPAPTDPTAPPPVPPPLMPPGFPPSPK